MLRPSSNTHTHTHTHTQSNDQTRAPRAGDESTANAKLLDVLRQVQCFGLALMRLDIRQESTRHTEVGFC